ncbi:P-loop containing nucleoside triphosphate hydrolase protein [Apiospora arundinis]
MASNDGRKSTEALSAAGDNTQFQDSQDDNQSIESVSRRSSNTDLLSDIAMIVKGGGTTEGASTHVEVTGISNTPPGTPEKKGDNCSIKYLYEGPPKCNCCINWVEHYPDDLRESVEETPEVKAKALVARKKKGHEDGKPLVLDSVVVQNQFLKEFLGELFQGYRGITPNLEKLVLKAPFRPFYYRWGDFDKLVNETDPEILKQTDEKILRARPFALLLYNLLAPEIQPIVDEVKDLVKNKVITYDRLWALFQPMERLYSQTHSHDRMFIHESHQYTKKGFFVNARYVDWDGKEFGYRSTSMGIAPFAEDKPIKELEVYPFDHQQSPGDTREELLRRGKKFRELCAVQHMEYTGVALVLDKFRGCYQRINLDERVVLDTALHWQKSNNKAPPLAPLKDLSLGPSLDVRDRVHKVRRPRYGCGNSDFQGFIDDYDMPAPSGMWSSDASISDLDPIKQDPPLEDDELVLCDHTLPAYSLSSKEWVILLDPDGVRAITWNERAFPSLVLPSGHKELVLSFVEAHISGEVQFDDIIEGKGLGLMMLLVGDPGLGKTLTAEAVAEKVHKPLYILSAGELGRDAEDVETALKDVLEMTAKWNAVLLLDECDVFLEERNSSRLDHNAIVAVFLRVIEYHNGILILTTNRYEAIDRAFQSRMHLTLRYPKLTSETKMVIWQQFVRSTKWAAGNTVTDDQYEKLASLDINGREIKNIVKTAFLLASREKAPLGLGHVKKVVNATMGDGLI